MTEPSSTAETGASHGSDRTLRVALYAALIGIVVFGLSKTTPDTDLWGHLKYGLDFIQAGRILQVDPYSYLTASTRWIDHEWLSEVMMALAYKWDGVMGLSIFRMTISVTVVVLLLVTLAKQKIPTMVTGALILIGLVTLTPGVLPVRPQLFTYLLATLEFMILAESEQTKDLRFCFLIPLIFALWINVHGGVLAGFAILLVFLFGYLVFENRKPKVMLQAAGCLLASTLVLGLTPYGFDLIVFLIKTGTVPRPEIPEWAPIKVISVFGISYLLLLATALWVLHNRMWQQRKATSLVLLACALLPFLAARHAPLAAIAIITLTARSIGEIFQSNQQLARVLDFSTPNKFINKALAAACVVAALVMVAVAVPKMTEIHLEDDMPVHAISLLKHSGVKGNMVCFFDWGEYCIWHLTPSVKISMDGRRETSYDENAYNQNVAFIYGVGDWDQLIKQEGTNLALLSKKTAAYALMRMTHDWELVLDDNASGLFARKGSPELAQLIAKKSQPGATDGTYMFP